MDKRRALWPVIAAVLVVLPVLYVLSIGPLLWLMRNGYLPESLDYLGFVYFYPIGLGYSYGPSWCQSLLEAYVNLWGATLTLWG